MIKYRFWHGKTEGGELRDRIGLKLWKRTGPLTFVRARKFAEVDEISLQLFYYFFTWVRI
ncbi:MAG: hypothetical protein FVQ79_04145 [Planctomycetes bacterium]|nr:hypothetical protein [Planctomycetota bacterium]